MISLLRQLLDIPSPTYKEQEIINFIQSWAEKNLSNYYVEKVCDNLIIQPLSFQEERKTIAFVGHCDVVPEVFQSYEKDDCVYGAGASDMLGSLACFLYFLSRETIDAQFNIILIIYSREEGTPLRDNGLYELVSKKPSLFKSIDFALIGEPTNNEIHLGCIGSLHYKILVKGEACHSARPWQGSNALYNALPLIRAFAQKKEEKVKIENLIFYDVMQITESRSEEGKTSLPSFWEANINYRFAPDKSEEDAKKKLEDFLKNLKIESLEFSCTSSVPSGKIISNEFSNFIINRLGLSLKAKQAWTDLSQFANLGIPAINFGAGFTAQAHKKNEFISKKYLNTYYSILQKTFC